jgi:hypothetical protein
VKVRTDTPRSLFLKNHDHKRRIWDSTRTITDAVRNSKQFDQFMFSRKGDEDRDELLEEGFQGQWD